jgi:hypothetical protein
MHIYNEQGDLTSDRVSNLSENISTRVSWLVNNLLAEGTPVVEVRAMLEYIDTEMKYAATLCLMEHRM